MFCSDECLPASSQDGVETATSRYIKERRTIRSRTWAIASVVGCGRCFNLPQAGLTMSGNNVGHEAIEMASFEGTEDPGAAFLCELTEEKKAVGQSYGDRFKSILSYSDKTHTWWDSVEELLKTDKDFAEKVSRNFLVAMCNAQVIPLITTNYCCYRSELQDGHVVPLRGQMGIDGLAPISICVMNYYTMVDAGEKETIPYLFTDT